MEYTVGSQIRIKNPSALIENFIKNKYTIDNPEYAKKERLGFWVGNTSKVIRLFYQNEDNLYVPFGVFNELWELEKAPTKVLFGEPQKREFRWNENIKLFDYQNKAVNELVKAKNGILVAKCGSGKTLMAMRLIHDLGLKTLWLTHTTKLLEQSKKVAINTLINCEIGEISDGKVNIGRDITFATIQTISKIDPSIYYKEFSLVICDECHKIFYNSGAIHMWSLVLNNLCVRYKFGLTATPYRADGMALGMFALLGKIAYEIQDCELKNRNVPVKYTQIELDTQINDSVVNSDGTLDYTKLITSLCLDHERNKNLAKVVANNYFENKNKSLILCLRVNQCEQLQKILYQIYGIKATYIKSGKNKNIEDSDILISTFQLIKEGYDNPFLKDLYLCSPIKDKVAIIQSVGRVQRVVDGKTFANVYDFVDVNISLCKNYAYTRKRIIKKL